MTREFTFKPWGLGWWTANGMVAGSMHIDLQWWKVVSPMVALSNTMAVSQCLNGLSRPLHEQTHVLLVSQIWDL